MGTGMAYGTVKKYFRTMDISACMVRTTNQPIWAVRYVGGAAEQCAAPCGCSGPGMRLRCGRRSTVYTGMDFCVDLVLRRNSWPLDNGGAGQFTRR
jgi:hypothetical protein